MKYESSIKTVGYPQGSVYAKLADLNNLQSVKQRLDDPDIQQRLHEQVPEDKIESVRQHIESLEVDTDSVSVDAGMIGRLTIRIVDREEPKCVKFQSVNSPIGFKLWVQLLPMTEESCKMKLTVDADVNPFMRMMVEKPLKEGIEKLADMLASLPYN